MLVKKRYASYINVFYVFCILFIFIGYRLMAYEMDIKIFFVFYEVLYIPIVFGLPILSVFIIKDFFKIKNKSFKVYLSLFLTLFTCVLFVIKMYFLLVEKHLIF